MPEAAYFVYVLHKYFLSTLTSVENWQYINEFYDFTFCVANLFFFFVREFREKTVLPFLMFVDRAS